jgi:hypothetical protein
MYELPEYKGTVKYWYVEFDLIEQIFIAKESWGRTAYDISSAENNIFATAELAQIEADRRNAQNKLMNLAREREKEFLIDWEDQEQPKMVFNFSWDHKLNKEIIYTYSITWEPTNAIVFLFDDSGLMLYWLRSVMTEQEIGSLCMPRRFV